MGFFKGKTVTTRADRIGDFQINSASYGEVVPEVLGTTRLSGNVIYWDDFTAHEHRDTQRSGKGGGGKHVSITYTYTVAAAIGLCEGPIEGIGKVWIDKEVYDYPSDSIQLTLFKGDYGQEPWPYVVGKHPEKALPYSGLAYMAGVVDLGDRGGLPTFNFEVKGKLLDTGDGIDVNPADYIVHILKSIGIKDTDIDGLEHYRNYCREANILISTPPDGEAKKAQAIINDIAEITNAYLFWSNNRLKIVPLADKPIGNWNPDLQVQYDLTADDLLPGQDGQLVLYKRKDSSEAFNQATVEFINRANGYEKETVSFEILADVQRNGLRPASTKQAHYLYTKERAQYFAEQLAMSYLYKKNQYTFHLDWAFCRLEPGDIVTLTDEICQLHKQIVVITSVTEAADGQLEITAVGRPPGIYSPAKHNVHENERPFVDYSASAPSITDAVFIQAPGDISGNEILLGVSAPDGWGGCNVWISDSGDTYKLMGSISRKARMGTLISTMNRDATTCHVSLAHGELKSGTRLDAERGNTRCWVNGECFSYETAALQPDGSYVLSGIIRGQYGTVATDHAQGATFVRLDEALIKAPYSQSDVGKTIYIKYTSMNIFGGGEQNIADVEARTYTISSYFIPEVTGLVLSTKYYEIGQGVQAFEVIASFVSPDITSFDTAECWYREGNAEWKFGGAGDGQIVISGCELGKTYDVKVKVKDQHGNYSQGVTKSIAVALKSETPNAPQGFSVTFGNTAVFNWLEVKNADIDFYELRKDLQPGQPAGLIGRSNNTSFSTVLQNRTGRVYVYAHNPVKGYSTPAILEYAVPLPVAPASLEAKASLGGLTVSFSAIPSNCKGAYVYTNETAHYVVSHSSFLPLEAGIYDVKVAYVDMFGEGAISATKRVVVKAEIDPSWIHITENTLFDDNVIVGRMLSAESVTAEKMKVDSLSAISGTLGTVTAGRIQNEDGSAYIDATGNIHGVNITGSVIEADSIFQSGYRVKDSMITYITLRCGEQIILPEGYLKENCLILPIKTWLMSKNECRAYYPVLAQKFGVANYYTPNWNSNDVLDFSIPVPSSAAGNNNLGRALVNRLYSTNKIYCLPRSAYFEYIDASTRYISPYVTCGYIDASLEAYSVLYQRRAATGDSGSVHHGLNLCWTTYCIKGVK